MLTYKSHVNNKHKHKLFFTCRAKITTPEMISKTPNPKFDRLKMIIILIEFKVNPGDFDSRQVAKTINAGIMNITIVSLAIFYQFHYIK